MERVKGTTALLVGEHALLRSFLLAWMRRFDSIRVVAEATGVQETLDRVEKHKPALVLIDFETLQAANIEVLSRLREGHPAVKVIIYFANSQDTAAVQLIRAGAAGFVVKSATSEDMESAIKTVLAGGVYLSPEFLGSLGTGAMRQGVPDKQGKILSPRQAEILKLLALGLTAKAIAFELKISAKTVDVHKQLIMKRLGETSTTGLVKYAIRTGLVPA